MSVLALKSFPEGFPNDVNDVLRAMSFTNGEKVKISGSMSLRSQLYAGDYDGVERIETHGSKIHAVKSLARKFKNVLRKLKTIPNTYIGDIKSGSIEEWVIIKQPYNYDYSIEKLEELYKKGIIDSDQYHHGLKVIKPKITKLEYLGLQRDFRPNIVRWKVHEVMAGHKTLIDGRKYTLEEAFQAPVITKLDVISWVQNNRFTDFSMIYIFRNNGKKLNTVERNTEEALRENIFMLYHEKSYFKMAKRIFSLAKFHKQTGVLHKFLPLFNGDAGRIYSLYGDIGTLEELLEVTENVPFNKIEFELDQFKARLSNINMESYIPQEHHIFNLIGRIVNMRSQTYSKTYLARVLEEIKKILEKLLNAYAKGYLVREGLFPEFQ
jgi:hypothetical protein